VVDIGGGSVEITRGTGPHVEMGRSFKLGVIRLTEHYVKSDPLEPRDERKLVRHIEAEFGDYLARLSSAVFDRLIGTSGTILSLGAVVCVAHGWPLGAAAMRKRRISATQPQRAR